MAGSEHIEMTLHDVEVEVDYCDLNEQDLVEFVVNEYPSMVLKALTEKGHPLELERAKDMVLSLKRSLGAVTDSVFEVRGIVSRLSDALGMEDDE